MKSAVATAVSACSGARCTLVARLLCPTCVKLGLPRPTASFCGQECFKRNWSAHKAIHKAVAPAAPENDTFDPFQSKPSCYTGTLRAVYPLSPMRTVPAHIVGPDYAESGRSLLEEREARGRGKIELLEPEKMDMMRILCKDARAVLDEGGRAVAPGTTTDAIDAIVHAACLARGCYPSPLNYYGFPKSVCTSVNEVICHGIPDARQLQDGDIVNIDVSIFRDGLHADLSETYVVGSQVAPRARKIADTARACLRTAIKAVRPGVMYRQIGDIIEGVATSRGAGVVRTYCGHGIHKYFHCAPTVPHYADNKAVGIMRPGHIFTIEPMVTEGDYRDNHWSDNWTAVTRDGKLSAQFEHTLLVTQDGCEVLTLSCSGHDVVMDGLPTSLWGPNNDEHGDATEKKEKSET